MYPYSSATGGSKKIRWHWIIRAQIYCMLCTLVIWFLVFVKIAYCSAFCDMQAHHSIHVIIVNVSYVAEALGCYTVLARLVLSSKFSPATTLVQATWYVIQFRHLDMLYISSGTLVCYTVISALVMQLVTHLQVLSKVRYCTTCS